MTPTPIVPAMKPSASERRTSTCPTCYGLGRTILGSSGLAGICGDPGWIDAQAWAKSIVRHHDQDRWLPDHACEACVGSHGDLVRDDFRCVFHQAMAYLASLPPAPDANDKAREGKL